MLPSEAAAETDGPTLAGVDAGPAQRERDLVSSVCHDLRGPLSSIVTGAGFLRKALPQDQAAALRAVEVIHRSAHRLDRMISTFSDLARLEMRDLALVIRPYDVCAIVREAYEQCLLDAQGIPVRLDMDPEVLTLHLPCDRQRLLQILQQLSACALRVVPEGGGVTMRARQESAGPVHFGVEARRREGAGGRRRMAELPKPELTIARGLIELHGGRLAILRDEDTLELSFSVPRTPQ